MISVELYSLEEYDNLNLYEDEMFLDLLKNEYPIQYNKALVELQDLTESSRTYTEKELREIFFIEDFVEVFEDIYFKTGDEAEVIKCYYVKDSVGTDKGTWESISAKGYVLLSEGLN